MKVNKPMPSFFIEVSRDAKSSKIADECAAFVYAFIYLLVHRTELSDVHTYVYEPFLRVAAVLQNQFFKV